MQLPVFRWFNQHLKGEDPVIEMAATKLFTPQQLKVFAQLPADAINTNAHETFVPSAAPPVPPRSEAEWAAQRDGLRAALTNQVFRGWPEATPALALEEKFSIERRGVNLRGFEFTSQEHVRLRFYVAQAAGAEKPARVNLNVLDATGRLSHGGGHWLGGLRVAFAAELTDELAASASLPAADEEGFRVLQAQLQDGPTALVCFSPRGLGADAWSGNERAQTHRRRRFMLLGQTLDGMRVWDIRRATQAVRELENLRSVPLTLSAREGMACNGLFAALFEPGLTRLDLLNLPASLRHGPDYLNALRFLDVPQVVAMTAERAQVLLRQTTPMSDEWNHPAAVARNLGWDASRFRAIALPPEAKPNGK